MASPLYKEIVGALEKIDGIGLYHAGAYYADASDCDLLRQRTARLLVQLNEADRERRLAVYRLWCEGKNDRCAWCGLHFVTITDAVAIEGRLFHGFFCSIRFTELSTERIELTDTGRAALGDSFEIEQECRAIAESDEKRAMFRGGITGCAVCGRSFASLDQARIEDGRLVHAEPCAARDARRAS